MNDSQESIMEASCYIPFRAVQREAMLKSKKAMTVGQALLNEIASSRQYSLKGIAEQTKLPLLTIRRIYFGITKNPRTNVFQRIFELYCQVCQ